MGSSCSTEEGSRPKPTSRRLGILRRALHNITSAHMHPLTLCSSALESRRLNSRVATDTLVVMSGASPRGSDSETRHPTNGRSPRAGDAVGLCASIGGALARRLTYRASHGLTRSLPALSVMTFGVLSTGCGESRTVSPDVSSSSSEGQSDTQNAHSETWGSARSTMDSGDVTPTETMGSNHQTNWRSSGRDVPDAGPETSNTPTSSDTPAMPSVELPPPNGGLDYQLGGGYSLPSGVSIVSRDRTDEPASGAYNICYINGFQVQPGEESSWESDLLLRDEQGELVIDQDWDEVLLDVSTVEKRARIAASVGTWIRGCAADGFDAVEIDNLDTFSRSGGRIDEDDAVAFMAALSIVAHDAGLAIAQKNSVELVSRRHEMGTDFVVAEECNAWRECDGYIDAYGANVLMIEYDAEDFERGCTEYGANYSLVLRDLDLTMPGDEPYVFSSC